MYMKCCRYLRAASLYRYARWSSAPSCSSASSSAIRSMLRQNMAIQAVPSDWSRVTPLGEVWLGSVEEADVIEAEEAALEDVSAVLVTCG